jgi:oligosaccharide repeat unit polymerase
MGVVWGGVVFGTVVGSKDRLYFKYGGQIEIFPPSGVLWLGLAITSFFVGTLLTRKYKLQFSGKGQEGSRYRYLQTFAFVKIFAAGVTVLLILWTLVAASKVGGLGDFIALMQSDWHYTRRLWPQQKPFPGARLLYTGLIACAIYAFTLLGDLLSRKRGLTSQEKWKLGLLFCLSLGPLAVLPLIVSQRILIASGLFGGGVAFLISHRDGVNPLFVVLLAIGGFSVWTTQEIIRTGSTIGPEAILHSIELVFHYFQVGFSNVTRGSAFMTERSYGLLSFSFIFEYLFIEDEIKALFLSDFEAQAGTVKSTGPWNALVTPYLDFGWFGLLLIAGWGYFAQLSYEFARNDRFGAQIYGLIGATIIVSFHQQFWSNAAFWFNLGLLIVFNQAPDIVQSIQLNRAILSETDSE